MSQGVCTLFLAPVLAILVSNSGWGAEAESEESWAPIEALLVARCVRCHDREKHSGDLALDTRAGLLAGGESGVAIVAGSPGQSLLLQKITSDDGKAEMPRGGPPLAAAEVEAVRRWIAEGAPWPDRVKSLASAPVPAPNGEWWSLRPLQRPPLPDTAAMDADLVLNGIDAYILRELRRHNLYPSREAERRVLIRRVYFDLIGLPPASEEVDRFEADPAPDAYEKLVDRLLASPAYGERWARHWLDVVHYGDTDDYGRDYLRPNAWPYRDYVIRSFNADKPYNRFAMEQLAGDVLHPESPDAVAATGFIVAGPWDYTGHVLLFDDAREKEVARYLDRDDMVTNAMSTFTSLTVHCARCHDHKFDPITQDDYYSLQAVFAGVNRAERPLDTRIQYDPAHNWWMIPAVLSVGATASVLLLARPMAFVARQTLFPRARSSRMRRRSALLAAIVILPIWWIWATNYHEIPIRAERKIQTWMNRDKPFRYDREYSNTPKVFAATTNFPRIETKTGTYGPTPDGKPRRVDKLARGNVDAPLGEARAGAVRCVRPLDSEFRLTDESDEGARRSALAHWVVDERHPLTWRSIVNRVWQYHFGVGIVDTPSDFGRMGSAPSHPELLDWLAVEFRDGGQSLKDLHRLIVTSSTYRQSSAHRDEGAAVDAQNRLLWRMNRRRLEAEAVRDSVLYLSGRLDGRMYGPGYQAFEIVNPKADIMQFEYDQRNPDDPLTQRRTIYRFITRSVGDPFLEALDCAAASTNVPVRAETNTALQALALLNNGFIVRQSEHFAAEISNENPDIKTQVLTAFRRIFGREPRDNERKAIVQFAAETGLPATCRLLFNLNEFTFVD